MLNLAQRIVPFACGAVLLAAVALKVQGSATGSSGESLALFSPRVQGLGLQVEALVGVWLVSGFARRGAWVAGVSLFALLALVSVHLIAVGQPSCGCFGRVEVSPWASLTLDAVCVFALIAARPPHLFEHLFLPRNWLRASAATGAVGALLLAATSQTAAREMARLRGESLFIINSNADAGTAPPGESRTVTITVENLTSHDVHLIGGTASCACVATGDLPTVVPARGQLPLNVRVKFTGGAGLFRHTFFWYTDARTQPRLTGSIAGHVKVVASASP